jgi:hypothetical protein
MASGHGVLGLSDHRLLGVEVLLLLRVVYLGVKGSTVRRLVWWKARYLIPRFLRTMLSIVKVASNIAT